MEKEKQSTNNQRKIQKFFYPRGFPPCGYFTWLLVWEWVAFFVYRYSVQMHVLKDLRLSRLDLNLRLSRVQRKSKGQRKPFIQFCISQLFFFFTITKRYLHFLFVYHKFFWIFEPSSKSAFQSLRFMSFTCSLSCTSRQFVIYEISSCSVLLCQGFC